MNALEVKNISKSFDSIKAVDNLSFSVPEGSVFGLIGRNGAGKTTTIRMLMNIYLPETGEIILRGSSVTPDFKKIVGYLPEERGLYRKMKVLDTLLFFAELKGKSRREVESKAIYYLKKFELYDRRLSKVEDLSKGNQQKLQFIATILHDPDFIVLDEPFSGLDPINTNILKEIIMSLKDQGKVIILSTHLMDFAEKMCDYLVMIHQGKNIMEGSLREIKERHAQTNVNIVYQGNISFLKDVPFVEKIENFGNSAGIKVANPSYIQELLKLLVERNITIKNFKANDISLHEIFVMLAGHEEQNEVKEAAHV